jgi:MFS family permease
MTPTARYAVGANSGNEMSNDRPADSRAGWLNSTVLGIGLASLFSDVGHEMATTAMPALLAMLGASPAALGVIEGLADGLSSYAKLMSGLFSDRLRRRKPLAVIGYFVTASGMASFAAATQWWHVLLGRVTGWLGRGVRTPVRKVLLAEATTPETYGRAFGLERSMDSAGAVIGPLLAVGLISVVGIRWLFVWTLIPGLLAVAALVFLVHERPHDPQPKARLWGSLRVLPAAFKEYLVGVGVAGIGDFSNTLLILWATEAWTQSHRFSPSQAATMAMLFYVGYNVVYTVSCYVSGMLADQFPKYWVLSIGYSLAVIPAATLLVPGDALEKFAIVFGFSGLYMGVWETLESATAATMLPGEVRGSGFGLLATVNGLGDLLSSIVVGVLWAKVSPVAAMAFVIATSLIGAAIIAWSGSKAARPV